MIRSSKHTLKFANKNKRILINQLILDYKENLQKYINILWTKQDSSKSFFGANDYNQIKTTRTHDSKLRQCASKQACSMIKAVLKKHHKRLFKLAQLQREKKDAKYLQRKISLTKVNKPVCKNVSVELDPRFIHIQETNNGYFDLFIQINEIGNKELIRIPIKHTKVSRKWLKEGRMLNSIRLKQDSLTLYFDIPKRQSKGTKTIGIYQGSTTVISMSNNQVTKKE